MKGRIKSKPIEPFDENQIFNLICLDAERMGAVYTHPRAYIALIEAVLTTVLHQRANGLRREAHGIHKFTLYTLTAPELRSYAGWLIELGFDGSLDEAVEVLEQAAHRLAKMPRNYANKRYGNQRYGKEFSSAPQSMGPIVGRDGQADELFHSRPPVANAIPASPRSDGSTNAGRGQIDPIAGRGRFAHTNSGGR